MSGERDLIREFRNAAKKQGRIAAAQRRKRKGTEASLERALDLLRRALDDDQDGYRISPQLEKEMRGAIHHQEALTRKRALEDARKSAESPRETEA